MTILSECDWQSYFNNSDGRENGGFCFLVLTAAAPIHEVFTDALKNKHFELYADNRTFERRWTVANIIPVWSQLN